jgi:hypothetical protein
MLKVKSITELINILMTTKIKLIFTVYGDFFNPHEFTELLQIKPTLFGFKGDIIPNRKNIEYKQTFWEYSSEFIETLDSQDISNIMIKQFGTSINSIRDYTILNSLSVKVYVVVEIFNNQSPSLFFDKLFINMIAVIGAEIDIDLYYI